MRDRTKHLAFDVVAEIAVCHTANDLWNTEPYSLMPSFFGPILHLPQFPEPRIPLVFRGGISMYHRS